MVTIGSICSELSVTWATSDAISTDVCDPVSTLCVVYTGGLSVGQYAGVRTVEGSLFCRVM